MRLLALCAIAALTALSVYAARPQAPTPLADLAQPYACGAPGEACAVNGRHYNALIPKGDGPFPVVLFFHGSKQSGDKTVRRQALMRPMLERGFAVIAPTALDVKYVSGPGTGWIRNGQRGDRDDHRFVREVLDDIETRFPVDTSRIVTTGFSNGGIFIWYLACAQIDPRLTAFAPAAGTPVRNRPGPCKDTYQQVDLLHTHGTQDARVPYYGSGPRPGWPGYWGASEAIVHAAATAGCRDLSMQTQERFTVQTWHGCGIPHSYSLATHQGGHATPAAAWAPMMLDWYEAL